jgi:hypothetical protein
MFDSVKQSTLIDYYTTATYFRLNLSKHKGGLVDRLRNGNSSIATPYDPVAALPVQGRSTYHNRTKLSGCFIL